MCCTPCGANYQYACVNGICRCANVNDPTQSQFVRCTNRFVPARTQTFTSFADTSARPTCPFGEGAGAARATLGGPTRLLALTFQIRWCCVGRRLEGFPGCQWRLALLQASALRRRAWEKGSRVLPVALSPRTPPSPPDPTCPAAAAPPWLPPRRMPSHTNCRMAPSPASAPPPAPPAPASATRCAGELGAGQCACLPACRHPCRSVSIHACRT